MKTQSQLNWTKEQLTKYGKVSRNQALAHYISRLGAIIDSLKKDGWQIEGKNVKENGGTNYYYYMVSKPKQMRVVVENGIARKIYE